MAKLTTVASRHVESNGERHGSAERWRQRFDDIREILTLPRVEVNLMYSAARENDPFYRRLVHEFYASTRRRHPQFPFIRQNGLGVALARLPETFSDYFMAIEAAGRRNVKKAKRLGYRFAAINFNDYLADVGEIRRSAQIRQGPIPQELLANDVKSCTDPPSTTLIHDWPYFGVLKDDKLVAYAGCFVCGEICFLEHIYGHSAYQSDGIVPMLIVGIAQHLVESRDSVRYFSYGTYFGAGETLRRFKRKFLFYPHKVKWILG